MPSFSVRRASWTDPQVTTRRLFLEAVWGKYTNQAPLLSDLRVSMDRTQNTDDISGHMVL
jgi:hypothetical protein